MDALDALKTRRSVRSFTGEALSREDLANIVDCGRLAATARNEQPWEFVVATDPDLLVRMAASTDHGKFIADAGACIVVLSADTKYYLEDCSAATQNMLVAARSLGLGSCWVAGDKKEYGPAICAMVGAPETMRLVSLIAVGHVASQGQPAKREMSDVMHWQRYGTHE